MQILPTKLKKYIRNNLVAWDQALNALTGGDEDETISSRVGKLQSKSRAACVFCKILAFFLGKDHCNKSIETDEGSNTILK